MIAFVQGIIQHATFYQIYIVQRKIMIRRVTPNKECFKKRSRSLCCGWICGQEKKEVCKEAKFSLSEKKVQKRQEPSSSNTSFCRREPSKVVFSVITYRPSQAVQSNSKTTRHFAPQNLRINTKMQYDDKQTLKTGLKTTSPGTMSTQGPWDLPESMMPSTPLDRLRKRTLFKRQIFSPRNMRLFESETKEGYQHFSEARTTDLGEMSISQSVKRSVMGDQFLLLSSVQKYRLEFQKLLEQYDSLSNERQENLDYYEKLLKKLAQKQVEMRERQAGKKEQLQEIKEEIGKLKLMPKQ